MAHINSPDHENDQESGAATAQSADPVELPIEVDQPSTLVCNKATQKRFTFRIQKPERRSKSVQASDEQKEIAVQCNIAGLPPLALLRSSEPMVSDESDNENICDEPYSPSTSDLDEEAAMEDGAVSNSETEMKSE
ncbi:hypothetical protein QZH41_019574, partial [Actinostola sp. cb2023]